MTMQEAMAFIRSTGTLGCRPGLERITELMRRLGDPQRQLRFVHITGTNGKGSTAAMLDAVLRAAGYRVGLFTSPHLQSYRERLRLDGADISEADFCAAAEAVRAQAADMAEHPTEFECITAMALWYFAAKGCDIVVLEVGLGGRLDATNVIPPPEAAVITNIGLEHTEYLGDTVEKIAWEKAGILKTGCAAVSYDSAPEALAVIRAVCAERRVPLTVVDMGRLQSRERSLEGQTFLWDGRPLTLPLLGEHQLHNAAAALETVETLRRRGWTIPEESVRRGLAATVWPARFEVLRRDPLFILDGGHNPQCAQALARNLEEYLPEGKLTFLVGVLADKDYGAELRAVWQRARRFVCVTPESPRALPAEALAAYIRERGMDAAAVSSVAEGVARSQAYGDAPVVAFGSLYMAGAIRQILQERWG